VCLRWTIDKGAIGVAGVGTNMSTVPLYAKQNLAVKTFELTAAEVERHWTTCGSDVCQSPPVLGDGAALFCTPLKIVFG
jgi:hypothetical protein